MTTAPTNLNGSAAAKPLPDKPQTATAVPAALAPKPLASRSASVAKVPAGAASSLKPSPVAPRPVVPEARTPPPPVSEALVETAKPAHAPKPKIGGVAPFVGPPSWFDRLRAGRGFERRGFVPLSPGRPKLRHRILPRSVIGISSLLMSFGVGAAFCGAAFYAYYDNRLAANEEEVARFVQGFDQQFSDASSALDELRSDSVDQIRSELTPLGEYVADANAVVGLPQQIGQSVWLVQSRDDAGRETVGSAFAVAEHRGGTALLTSYSLVQASTVSPGPGIQLTKNGESISATLWSWDANRDLALVVTDRAIPPLTLADPVVQAESVGGRVFAMSGLGGQGATASPGVLLDRSAIGLQHTAVVGTAFVGGPLVDGSGTIVGVATANYQPLGIDPGPVSQAPDVPAICAEILSCADAPAAGESNALDPEN